MCLSLRQYIIRVGIGVPGGCWAMEWVFEIARDLHMSWGNFHTFM
jgi:hypothetical protein